MIRVLGLDLSLTSTGWAHQGEHGVIRTSDNGVGRLINIRDKVRDLVGIQTDLVVIEGYAYGRPNQATHLGELGGVIRVLMWELLVPFVEISPATLKKTATGNGNAPKEEMLAAAIRRLGYTGHSFDEADAMWLAWCGEAAYGWRETTKQQADALRKVAWPPLPDVTRKAA